MENDFPPPPHEPESKERDSEDSEALTSIYDSGAPVEVSDSDVRGEKELGGRMTFLEHLDELRKRIVQSLIALVLTSAAGWIFREQIFEILRAPLGDAVQTLVYTKVTDTFTIWLKIAVAFGIFLASPFILLQVWLFISPGLYRKEKKYSVPFLVSGTAALRRRRVVCVLRHSSAFPEFLNQGTGCASAAHADCRRLFQLRSHHRGGHGGGVPAPRTGRISVPVRIDYTPLSVEKLPLRNTSHLHCGRRRLPTPDALNLSFWAGPMILLYLGSIGVSWVFQRRRLRAEAREQDG